MTALPRQVLEAGGVWVVDDRTTTFSVLAVGRVVDVHGDPLTDVSVTCARLGTHVRRAAGGHFVVSGIQSRVLPNLATAADALPLVLEGPDRPALRTVVAVPQGAALPVLHGDVYLPARPSSLVGQVRRLDLSAAPVADALVSCLPDAALPGLHPVALRTAVWSDHPGGTTTVRAATVTSLAAVTSVPAGARAGDTVIELASNAALTGGVVLRFGAGAVEHYGLVREVVDSLVILAAPLSASVRPGAPARAVSVTPAGPIRTLIRAALAGDGLLCLDADLAAEVVEIDDGGAKEAHAVGARADAAGFYRLSGVRELPSVALKATAAGLAGSQPVTVRRLHEGTTHHVDLDVQP